MIAGIAMSAVTLAAVITSGLLVWHGGKNHDERFEGGLFLGFMSITPVLLTALIWGEYLYA